MTVGVETLPTSYTGDGVTRVFPLGFTYSDAADVVVVVDGNTVTGGIAVIGDNVAFDTAPASGKAIVFDRSTPLKQESEFPANGRFPSVAHEVALDRQMRISAEQANKLARLIHRRGPEGLAGVA